MSDLKENITIPKIVATYDDLDYEFLREKGQEYIEQLAGNIWTDYNEHDPGITILEMLSYAITDLALRIDMPLENILAPESKAAQKISDQFFSASSILPSKAVTAADYRKIFIDLEGVKNCWLRRYDKKVYVDCKNDKLSYNKKDFKTTSPDFKKEFLLKGLYCIVVDYDEEITTKVLENKVNERIKKLYHANRNLCEDLIDVSKVEEQKIAVCANIELYNDANEELVNAKILRTLQHYLSPSVNFYSLRQMAAKGYTTDEIFEGPLLKNGFIDNAELEEAKLRSEVRLSDIIQLLVAVDGVKEIKDISIKSCENVDEEKDSWLICIKEGKKPALCTDSAFSFYKGVLPVNVNKKQVQSYLAALKKEEKEVFELAKVGMEPEIPTGMYLNTGETTTIQNDFPETYGIGSVGLSSNVSTQRKSQALQLKGYLLFFDQILAAYFAHLGKVKDLLSVNNNLRQTYFTQAVKDVKGLQHLVKDYILNDNEKLTKSLLSKLDDQVERKNLLLDHLIARFAEKFSDYAFLMKQLYGNTADAIVLDSKERFLKNYPETSKGRGSAFNYFQQPGEPLSPDTGLWNTPNVSGVQKRIARLIGMKDFSRRNLSDSLVEFYDPNESDTEKVYRWRIRNKKGHIILSATENYKSLSLAQKELFLAVVKIIETPPETVEKAFLAEIKDEDEIGNFEIQISPTGKYSFDIIDMGAPPTSSKRIIARQFSYYKSQEELKSAILEIIDFMVHDFSEEGMFLVEHILLRPDVTKSKVSLDVFMPVCTDNCESCEPVDPYSFRVTIVLPGFTYRFSNPDFRDFLEDLIRKELPAHILARICWVGHRKGHLPDEENDLVRLEKVYKEFLLSKTNAGQAQNEVKLKAMNNILSELNTIYPHGELIDCDDEDENLDGKIIVGRTNIGTL